MLGGACISERGALELESGRQMGIGWRITLFLDVLAGCGARAFGNSPGEHGQKLANGGPLKVVEARELLHSAEFVGGLRSIADDLGLGVSFQFFVWSGHGFSRAVEWGKRIRTPM